MNEITKLYNDEIELVFEPGRHLYTVDGKRVTGVTGATGKIDKPALIWWAVGCAIDHIEANLKPGVSLDEVQIKTLLADAKYAHRKKSSKAADMGTMIHQWIEDYIKADKDNTKHPEIPVNEELKASVNAFLTWIKNDEIRFVESETKIYSKKFNYAGTLDFTAYLGKRKQMVVGDIKTSNGIYADMFYQTSAYQFARQEEYPEEKYWSNIIVRCGKDGTLEVVESRQFKKNFKVFKGLLAVYNREQELKSEKFKKLVNSVE